MYFPPTSKSSASLVRSIVALEGGNDGRSCHSLSDRVAWQPPSDDHAVPPVSGQRLADPPKVSSSLESIPASGSSAASQRGQISSGAEQSGSGPWHWGSLTDSPHNATLYQHPLSPHTQTRSPYKAHTSPSWEPGDLVNRREEGLKQLQKAENAVVQEESVYCPVSPRCYRFKEARWVHCLNIV